MSDRFHSLLVVLEKDMRDDDAAALINAIQQMRGVLGVTGNVSDISHCTAEMRIRRELGAALADVLFPVAK